MAFEPFRLRLLDAHTGATFDGIYRDAGGPIARVIDEFSVSVTPLRVTVALHYPG